MWGNEDMGYPLKITWGEVGLHQEPKLVWQLSWSENHTTQGSQQQDDKEAWNYYDHLKGWFIQVE